MSEMRDRVAQAILEADIIWAFQTGQKSWQDWLASAAMEAMRKEITQVLSDAPYNSMGIAVADLFDAASSHAEKVTK